MELFENGVKLSKSLRNHLDSAEQRIEILMNDSKDKIKIDKIDERGMIQIQEGIGEMH